jgi:hypothetical protein
MIKVTQKGSKAYVTFTHKPEVADTVTLCGEWSDWNEEEMKMKKNGEFWVTKVLPSNSMYQFGYSVDGTWQCDDELECIDSPFGSQNSLLKL